MKLSEAIRVGSKKTNKNIGTFFDDSGGACAIGAAFLADTGKCGNAYVPFSWVQARINSLEPNYGSTVCPACGISSTMFHVISHHLNDLHDWSREAIAEWVEVQENKLEEIKGDDRGTASRGKSEVAPVVPEETVVPVELYPVEVK